MTNLEWSEIGARASERDPRQNPYGYLTGGSFVLDSARVFLWFPTLDELISHIRDVEPRVRDLEPDQGLEEYQIRVSPILKRVREEGLTEALREELRPEQDGRFVGEWWGTYDELREGRGEPGRELLNQFLDEERAGQALTADEEDDFVEFLQTCRV